MPAKCPNCSEAVQRGPDGEYPSQCPLCGVRLKTRAKQAVRPQPRAAVVLSEPERVVRSFSASSATRAPETRVDAPDGFSNEESENPFEADDRSPPATLFAPIPPFEAVPFLAPSPSDLAAAENPFASTVVPAKPAAVADNPFGVAPIAPLSKKRGASVADVVRWSVIGVLSLGLLAGGAWMYRNASNPALHRQRDKFENSARDYRFFKLDKDWKRDEAREMRAGFDMAFHRADAKAWVTIRTEEPRGETPLLREVADHAVLNWKDRVRDFEPLGLPGKTTLAGQPAEILSGEGTLDGLRVRCQTLCMVHQTIVYELNFEAPKDRFAELERDFTLARHNFELIGGHSDETKPIGENDLATFSSKKYPYRLQALARIWREAPDLQTDSRFDDLKLIDRLKLGELTVAPRKEGDLALLKTRYLERLRKTYEGKVRERPNDSTELSVNGRQSLRIAVVVTTVGGDFLIHATFIKGDGLVFTVQGRAPAEKRDVYEPMFAKIVDSFEVLDKAPEPPKTEIAKAAAGDEMKKPRMEPEKPVAMDPVKPVDESPKMVENKVPTKSNAAPTAGSGKMRPSLDDLDADSKPGKKTADGAKEKKAEEKPKMESKEAKKKPDPKKKKSLDDLD